MYWQYVLIIHSYYLLVWKVVLSLRISYLYYVPSLSTGCPKLKSRLYIRATNRSIVMKQFVRLWKKITLVLNQLMYVGKETFVYFLPLLRVKLYETKTISLFIVGLPNRQTSLFVICYPWSHIQDKVYVLPKTVLEVDCLY